MSDDTQINQPDTTQIQGTSPQGTGNDTPSGTTQPGSNWEDRYKELQRTFTQNNEKLKTYEQQLQAMAPKLETIDKIAGVFQPKEQELSFVERLERTLPHLEQKTQQLEAMLAQSQQATTDIAKRLITDQIIKEHNEVKNHYMTNVFGDNEQAYATFEQELQQRFPNIVTDVFNGTRSLDSFIKEALTEHYLNPESSLRKSIEEQAKQKALMKGQNFFNRNSSVNGTGATQPGFKQPIVIKRRDN